MKSIIFVIMAAFLISCTPSARLSPHYKGVNNDLRPYLDSFKEEIAPNKYDLTIDFDNLPGTTAGTCFYIPPKKREIAIDRYQWLILTPAQKEGLVYHELAHCTCNMGHEYILSGIRVRYDGSLIWSIFNSRSSDGFFKDKCPKSLMYPNILDHDCYKKHRKEYIKHLKSICK